MTESINFLRYVYSQLWRSKEIGIVILICSIISIKSSAQETHATEFQKAVDFLPPPPNAWAMVQYGNASLNKNTGAPTISIPFFTTNGGKLSTTVSIGYSSSGIKVDEIASRVGMGWSLNAGGVITRTVRGIRDEHNFRHYPYAPIGNNWSTFMFLVRIAQSASAPSTSSNNSDSEPDVFNFSFDGYSGSFVLDVQLKPVLINKNGLKIERDFDSPDWTFKITNTEGVVYYFGGNGFTEKTKRTQSCGRSHDYPVPNAWYLKKAVHPNGEEIVFDYTPITYHNDNGVSQNMYGPAFIQNGATCNCPIKYTSTCVNLTETNGFLLTGIHSTGNWGISFEYINRSDCDDKLLSKVRYGEIGKTPKGTFELYYTNYTSDPQYDNEVATGFDKTPYLTTASMRPSH